MFSILNIQLYKHDYSQANALMALKFLISDFSYQHFIFSYVVNTKLDRKANNIITDGRTFKFEKSRCLTSFDIV